MQVYVHGTSDALRHIATARQELELSSQTAGEFRESPLYRDLKECSKTVAGACANVQALCERTANGDLDSGIAALSELNTGKNSALASLTGAITGAQDRLVMARKDIGYRAGGPAAYIDTAVKHVETTLRKLA